MDVESGVAKIFRSRLPSLFPINSYAVGMETGNSVHLFLGTFPPRQCGIATFTKDLVSGLDRASGSFSEIVAVDDELPGVSYAYSGRVVGRLRQHDRTSYTEIASFVNAHPARTLDVQHEFGIYGGNDGEWLPNPSDGQYAVIARLSSVARRKRNMQSLGALHSGDYIGDRRS